MGNRHMTSRQAVILAGALAAVILILLIPVWRGVAWSDEVVEDDSQQPATKVAVEATPEDNEDTASGGAVRAVVRVSSGSSIDEFIDTTGKTLADRVALPEGYEQDAQEEELAQYLRDYSVYKKTKIKYYTGRTKSVSGEAVAVLKLPIEEVNLQQQTASVQRMYGEYFWSKGEYDRIKFTVSGTQVQFAKEGQEAGTYEDFVKFLQQKVYPASGYRSLLKDCKSVKLSKIKPGDVWIQNGSVVMVVDVCVNAKGKKAFLLAQGGSPAQQFHVILNPLHPEDPWYYQKEIQTSMKTPTAVFSKESLYRPQY
ncbi:MAG: DUF4846 domain-containing protein [Eubacterium sp.]